MSHSSSLPYFCCPLFLAWTSTTLPTDFTVTLLMLSHRSQVVPNSYSLFLLQPFPVTKTLVSAQLIFVSSPSPEPFPLKISHLSPCSRDAAQNTLSPGCIKRPSRPVDPMPALHFTSSWAAAYLAAFPVYQSHVQGRGLFCTAFDSFQLSRISLCCQHPCGLNCHVGCSIVVTFICFQSW